MRWLLRPGNSGHVSIGSSPGPDQYLLGGLAIAVGYARSNSLGLSAETTVRAVELAIAIGYNRIDAGGNGASTVLHRDLLPQNMLFKFGKTTRP